MALSDEFYRDCTIIGAGTSPSGIPSAFTGIKNLDYVPPTHWVNYFQILLYGDGEWLEHRWHLMPGTLTIVDKAQLGISTCKMTLEDLAWPATNQPFTTGPQPRMRLQVLNLAGSRCYFKGYLNPPKPDPVLQRPDLTEARYIQITANDETELFKRKQIQEVVNNTTEGANLFDLTARYCPELDPTGIDITLGAEIEQKIIDKRFLFQLFQEFLKLNPECTFWLERKIHPAKTKVWLQRRGSSTAVLSTEVTDANVYKLFDRGSFWLSKNDNGYNNRITLQYYELWNQGTVNVSKGDTIIYGFGTDWRDRVFAGDTFRLAGSENTYTVDHANTSAPGVIPVVQEIYITSEMQDETATGVAYELVRSKHSEEVAEDLGEIEALKLLNEEPGEHGGVRETTIPPGPNALLKSEAVRLVNMLLRFNLYAGGATTNNAIFPEPDLAAGQTMRVNRPLTGIPPDDVILQEITLRDGKGRPSKWAETRPQDPYLLIGLSMTDRLFSEDARFQEIFLSLRRPKIRDSQSLTVSKSVSERSFIGDCVAGSDGEPVDEPMLFADAVASADVSTTGPWYAGPVDGLPGDLAEIYAIDLTHYWEAS